MNVTALIAGNDKSRVSAWPPPPRAPLPPFPAVTLEQPPPPRASCWAAQPYFSELPNIPDRPDLLFHRGNFCGVRVPGLTEGGSSTTSGSPFDASFDTTWDWTRYDDGQMRLAVDWHADGCGYTHGVVSRPQTLNQGRTLADLQRVCRYLKARGMFTSVVAVSDGVPFRDGVDWLDALYAERLINIVNVCWQVDKWYAPAGVVELLNDAGAWANPKGIPVVVHWGGGYPGWAENCACWDAETARQWGITSRETFQQHFASVCAQAGHYGQCNTESDIDQVQSWISKIVVAFHPGMFFACAEDDAQAEFDWPYERLELYGDMKGRLAVCAKNYGVSLSYLNGARRENGRVL